MLCVLWVLLKCSFSTGHFWYLLTCCYVCVGEYGDSEQFEILIVMTAIIVEGAGCSLDGNKMSS